MMEATTQGCIDAVRSGDAEAMLDEEAVVNWFFMTNPDQHAGLEVVGGVKVAKKHYFGARERREECG